MIWFALIVLLLLLAGSAWLNVHTIRKNLELNDQREELVTTIEEALDMLESCYGNIAHAAQLDVLSDEPVIRDLLNDIKRAKNAVMLIASKVVTYGVEKGAQDDAEDE